LTDRAGACLFLRIHLLSFVDCVATTAGGGLRSHPSRAICC
jgi:hypothetical protein